MQVVGRAQPSALPQRLAVRHAALPCHAMHAPPTRHGFRHRQQRRLPSGCHARCAHLQAAVHAALICRLLCTLCSPAGCCARCAHLQAAAHAALKAGHKLRVQRRQRGVRHQEDQLSKEAKLGVVKGPPCLQGGRRADRQEGGCGFPGRG